MSKVNNRKEKFYDENRTETGTNNIVTPESDFLITPAEDEETVDNNDNAVKEESPAKVETTVPPTVTKNGKIVNAIHVNVRTKPNLESDVLEILRKGDKVTILEMGESFCKVSTSKNKIAYISSKFIEEE